MQKTNSYSEKLRDPRWQKKRLQIMERDQFKCQECLAEDKTLNVHHCFYIRGKEPWEYPDSSLITLCEEHHEVETKMLDYGQKLFLDAFSSFGWRFSEFQWFAYILHDLFGPENPKKKKEISAKRLMIEIVCALDKYAKKENKNG